MFGRRARIVRRVLIAEDEPLIAFDNEHLLVDAGFEVVATVDSAPGALRVIETEPLDLVLADVGLRGGDRDGLDVARAAAGKGVRVLFASGQCPTDAEAFAVGCLGKPFTQRDLLDSLDVIEALAAGRKPRRAPRALKLFGQQA